MLKSSAFLLMLLFSSVVSARTLDITIVTAQSENREISGKSFAGITVEPQRPVLRAVELALFESKTLFETLGVKTNINQLELIAELDVQQQLKTISSSSLVILDLPLKTHFV